MKALIMIAVCVLGFSQVVIAASINDRQENQKARIAQGVKSGELTKGETASLVKQQGRIAQAEARFKADGKFTKRERAKVQRKQTKASARIFKQKHDRQNRKK